nr:Mediator of U snRNA nuclear export PHAX [Ipomoea batatas]
MSIPSQFSTSAYSVPPPPNRQPRRDDRRHRDRRGAGTVKQRPPPPPNQVRLLGSFLYFVVLALICELSYLLNLIGLMEIGCGIPNGLHGVENFEDGKDIKMSELEEGELVEMISKTELGENSAIVSKIESQETRAGTENLVNKDSGKKKSYLVWNAVACLGVSALSDLVKEVEAIQACGGQKTADGLRFRIGGGILWNVIKAREPNAYKEIMKRGKEFEKQLKQVPKTPLIKQEAKDATSQNTPCTVTDKPVAIASDGSSLPSNMMCDSQEQSTSGPQRQSVYNRIRMPVSYDDLFEEDIQQNAL